MTTQPMETSARIVSVDLPNKMVDELERRAASMYLTADEYVFCVLVDCMENGRMLVMQEE